MPRTRSLTVRIDRTFRGGETGGQVHSNRALKAEATLLGSVNVREVLPPDAIPSIDDPTFSREYFGDQDDEVVVVDQGSDGPRTGSPARAYPIRVLSYHEVVNDEIGGRPLAVTWCPICWSAVVYERRVADRTLTFGVSGKLADDALVLYDRETGSEWKQPTGECIAGAFEGRRLAPVPAPIVPYERFRTDHPDGAVLQPVREAPGQSPADVYDMARYRRYVEGEAFGLYGMRGEGERRPWDREDLDAKAVVYGVERGEAARAYPVERVEQTGGVVSDTVGDSLAVVFTTGEGVHVYENPGYEFETAADDSVPDGRVGTVHADGATWDPVSGESDDGRTLARLPARQMFAFAWQDAHGPDAFWEP